jgi:hypothetical protein
MLVFTSKKKKEETKCYCACRLPLINHLLAMVFTVKRVACVCVRAFLEVEGGEKLLRRGSSIMQHHHHHGANLSGRRRII